MPIRASFSYPKEKRDAYLVDIKMALDTNSKTSNPKPRYVLLTSVAQKHGISERTGRAWAEGAGVITVIPRKPHFTPKTKKSRYSQSFKDMFLRECRRRGIRLAARDMGVSASNYYNWIREKIEKRESALLAGKERDMLANKLQENLINHGQADLAKKYLPAELLNPPKIEFTVNQEHDKRGTVHVTIGVDGRYAVVTFDNYGVDFHIGKSN